MSWINSRKKACDKCGKRMLICNVVNLSGVSADFCTSCAKDFIRGFETYQAQKKEQSSQADEHIEISSNLPYVKCRDCNSLIIEAIVGYDTYQRDAKLCLSCMQKRMLAAIGEMDKE